MHLYCDKTGTVRLASSTRIVTNCYDHIHVEDSLVRGNPIGKRVVRGHAAGHAAGEGGVRLAVVCNYGDACGIATYSEHLVKALRPLVADLRVFAEHATGEGQGGCGAAGVEYCWRRGWSMVECVRHIIAWRPTVVLIQHEFGIFPKAQHLIKMFEMLESAGVPHVVTLHSVYEHLDKVVCTGAMKNIVVHSEPGRDCLRRLGHTAEIEVIPHGCVVFDDVSENWNILHTPYSIVQFGFGFAYKGVDVALAAVARLKADQPSKYGDEGQTPVHYCYLCSESPHVRNITNNTYSQIRARIEALGLMDNAVVIRGYQTDEVLNQYLRTYKLAVFPYITDPANVVYGASGAARLAMANRIPTIVSSSHMFDDLEGVLPRPRDAAELAAAIDDMFSDHRRRERVLAKQDAYVRENSWPAVASRYLAFLESRSGGRDRDTIFVGG